MAALGVLVAALALVWSALTSSARVSGTTSSSGFFEAGVVTLTRETASAELLFDADGLYPGMPVDGCVEVRYEGSVPADIRLHAERRGGTGLEDYVDVRAVVDRSGTGCGAAGSNPQLVFEGRLVDLWRSHPAYDSGIPLAGSAVTGELFTISARAVVIDDNRAQGRSTDFSILVEARP